jgi:ABC-2 type transport system ATP-binding protein
MPLLRASDLTKNFATTQAVRGLNFEIQHGEIFALLGPNGAGKTTTLRLLLGILEPDAGSIEYRFGAELVRRAPAASLGYLPEDRGLYPQVPLLRTLVYLGQLRGMSEADAERGAMGWLERFGLADRAKERMGALSKGNQQKVQFIAALLHRPEFVILDEPFSGLDPVNQEMVLDLLRELKAGGTTVLLSGHQIHLIERVADRVLLMHRGRRRLYGTVSEVRHAGTRAAQVRAHFMSAPAGEQLRAQSWYAAHVEHETDGWHITLQTDAPLEEALRWLSNNARVRSLRAEPRTLHEVYVETVQTEDVL